MTLEDDSEELERSAIVTRPLRINSEVRATEAKKDPTEIVKIQTHTAPRLER